MGPVCQVERACMSVLARSEMMARNVIVDYMYEMKNECWGLLDLQTVRV